VKFRQMRRKPQKAVFHCFIMFDTFVCVCVRLCVSVLWLLSSVGHRIQEHLRPCFRICYWFALSHILPCIRENCRMVGFGLLKHEHSASRFSELLSAETAGHDAVMDWRCCRYAPPYLVWVPLPILEESPPELLEREARPRSSISHSSWHCCLAVMC